MPHANLPAASLVKAPVSLRSFCAMVGRAAFGSEWHDDDAAKVNLRLDRRPSDEPTLRQWFVAEQVLLALQTSVIRAGVRLHPENKVLENANRPTSPAEEHVAPRYFRDLNSPSDAIEDLNPLDDPTVQIVDARYWLDPTKLLTANVDLSYCEVPLDRLHYLGPDDTYQVLHTEKLGEPSPQDFRGSVFIIDAHRALRHMYSYKSIPDPEWFERYCAHRNRVLDEVTAAAWRFIAISKIADVYGRKAKIIGAMRDYMRFQGLTETKGLSDKVLEVLAGKIVRQWQAGDVRAPTLLNSTPEAATKARKRKS